LKIHALNQLEMSKPAKQSPFEIVVQGMF